MLITLHCWAIWSLWLVVWYVHRILTTVCPCEGKMCRCCWPFAHSIWFCIFSHYAMDLVWQRSESWATMGWGHGEVYLTGHVKCSFSYFLDLQSVHLFTSSCVEDLSLMMSGGFPQVLCSLWVSLCHRWTTNKMTKIRAALNFFPHPNLAWISHLIYLYKSVC